MVCVSKDIVTGSQYMLTGPTTLLMLHKQGKCIHEMSLWTY
jgi:hypothetical protein